MTLVPMTHVLLYALPSTYGMHVDIFWKQNLSQYVMWCFAWRTPGSVASHPVRGTMHNVHKARGLLNMWQFNCYPGAIENLLPCELIEFSTWFAHFALILPPNFTIFTEGERNIAVSSLLRRRSVICRLCPLLSLFRAQPLISQNREKNASSPQTAWSLPVT